MIFLKAPTKAVHNLLNPNNIDIIYIHDLDVIYIKVCTAANVDQKWTTECNIEQSKTVQKTTSTNFQAEI